MLQSNVPRSSRPTQTSYGWKQRNLTSHRHARLHVRSGKNIPANGLCTTSALVLTGLRMNSATLTLRILSGSWPRKVSYCNWFHWQACTAMLLRPLNWLPGIKPMACSRMWSSSSGKRKKLVVMSSHIRNGAAQNTSTAFWEACHLVPLVHPLRARIPQNTPSELPLQACSIAL